MKKIKILAGIIILITVISSIVSILNKSSYADYVPSDRSFERPFYPVYQCENGHICTPTGAFRTGWGGTGALPERQTELTRCVYYDEKSTDCCYAELKRNEDGSLYTIDKLIVNTSELHMRESYNNMYCVAHKQDLSFSTARNFEATAVAHITGNNVTFTNYYYGDSTYTTKNEVTTIGQSGEINNLVAAILNGVEMEHVGYKYPNTSAKDNYAYTEAQLSLWVTWNDWVNYATYNNESIKKECGFETGTGNLDFGSYEDEAYEEYEKVKEAASNGTYSADIYFLRYIPHNNPSSRSGYINVDNSQNLIIIDIPETTQVPVEKIWVDNDNANITRPNSITVKLLANDIDTGKTLTLSAPEWSGIFSDLPRQDDAGNVINYTIKESGVPSGYSSVISGDAENGFIITNTLERIDIPVTKVWSDNSSDNNRPESIEVKLLANGVDTGEALTLTSPNWSGTFTDLEIEDDNGNAITYAVQEVSITGYISEITGNQTIGFTITNTLKTIDIPVTKKWQDGDNQSGKRPVSIKVTLYEDGKATDKTAELNESNNWKYTFEDLPEYKNENKVTYTVEETGVPGGYISEVTGSEETGYIITNTHYDGYIEISGKVWEDNRSGKGNDINGTFGSEDTALEGIKVTLKDKDGNAFDGSSPVYTNSDGTYTIKVNYDNSQNVYKLYQDAATVNEKIKTAYVEFEYNGIKYTTVKTADSGENTSKAKENETTRTELDNKYSKVTAETVYPDSENMTASTQSVIAFETYSDKITENSTEVIKYCDGNGNYEQTNPENASGTIISGTHTCPNCSKEAHSMKTHDVEVQKIQNVNLGLFKREQPDVAIFSDLSKVEVTMLGQKYTYLYNVRSNENNNVGLQAKFQNKDTYTYKRPVNPANIAYVNDGNDSAMSVLVTYEVKVANLSTTLPITVHNITNYYDSRYTLNTSDWTATTGTQFNQATYNGDLNITVEPGKESSAIELTYTVSIDAIKSLLQQDATLNNAVEIESYSTKYGETTLYAEQQTGGRTGKAYGGYDYNSHPGNAEIFINDEGRLEATKLEDDTDIAPSFVLCKDKETITLSGTVWEDSDADNGNGPDNFRVGDGVFTDKDGNKKVANVKVELYKVKADGTTELAKLYNKGTNAHNEEIDAVTYTDNEGNYSFGDDNYGVVTDVYMIKFTYGDAVEKDGSIVASTIDGVKINARNYKSTIISKENENLKNVFKGTSTSSTDEWHLNMNDGYSIAVDDIEERLKLEDLQYSNFDEPFNMVAYSKTFKMQLEFDPYTQKTVAVGNDGKTVFGNDLSIFDFGIIERAREDIFVETTIDSLKITLANGQVLTEGKPGEEMQYAKAIGFNQTIENGTSAKRALDKQLIAEIDAELLQGAQLEVKYAIKVTNNSEKEYDYYVGDQIKSEYYYFGTNGENAPEIKGSVNYLVDYLDAELEYTWENQEDWTQVTVADLRVEGQELVSEATMNALNSGKYVAYATTKYSELSSGETSETDYLTATKVLTNKEENVYDNHAEILKINAKVARTIKGKDENGTPVVKDYKPGNYIPSLESRTTVASGVALEQAGMHEQDDDRVKITITPPTGAENYIIIYVIAGLVGLIVMVVGVIFIKKKVLTK